MNILLMGILVFACFISVLFGLRYAWIFIDAIVHQQNLIKYKKHLILAFIHIFIIPFLIFFVFSILSSMGYQGSVPLIAKESSSGVVSEFGYITSNNKKVYLTEQRIIELEIKNKDGMPREFKIEVSCPSQINCKDNFIPEKQKILLNPGVTIVLPVEVISIDSFGDENFDVNFSIVRSDQLAYDTITLNIIP